MPRTYIYALCKYRKYHKRVHTNERPYKCGICESTFKRPSTRTNHVLIHLKIKPFKCTECNYGTTTNQNLKKHMAVKHPRPVLPVYVATSVLSYPDADATTSMFETSSTSEIISKKRSINELESNVGSTNFHLIEPLNNKVARIDTEEIENDSNEESERTCSIAIDLFEDAFQQDYDQPLFSFQDDYLNIPAGTVV